MNVILATELEALDLIDYFNELTLLEWVEFIVAVITILGTLSGIGLAAIKLTKSIIYPYRQFLDFVAKVYPAEVRDSISKYYVPTRAQDIDPCEQDEIRENNGKFLSERLIPFFCKKGLRKNSWGKYFLILADSGMGKTTFLLRLYRDYLLQFPSREKKNIVMIPLSLQKCIQDIQKINYQDNTILLLDALDENIEAIENYDVFFTKILESTEGFYKVVITCRTQFFPNRSSEPEVTGRIQTGSGKKSEEIVKKYLSPFSDEEVQQYLRKRYRFNMKIQKKSYRIVQKVPVLMARPIVLNWMDFLCNSTEEYEYSFQIYSTIIDKWIEREALGSGSEALFELSLSIADYMFKNETTSMPADVVEQIAKKKEINLQPIVAKSRSLLNRNGLGEYKFAHRSFLEYFLVFTIYQRMQFPVRTDFLFSLSGVRRFLLEILLCSIQDEGKTKSSTKILEQLNKFVHADNVLEVLNSKEVQYIARNNNNGFTLTMRLNLTRSDAFNPEYIVAIDDLYFIERDSDKSITLHHNRSLILDLNFDVKRGKTHPITVLEYAVITDKKDPVDEKVLQLQW